MLQGREFSGEAEAKEFLESELERDYGEVIYASPKRGVGVYLKYFPFLLAAGAALLLFLKLRKLKANV